MNHKLRTTNYKLCKTNPISEMLKMKLSSVKTKDYENKRLCGLRENKPNSNPKQTQSNPISNPAHSLHKNTKKCAFLIQNLTFFVISCDLFDLFATRQDGLFFTLPADYEKPVEDKLLLPPVVENDIIVWL